MSLAEDFAADVSAMAERVLYVTKVAGPMIATAACIEAACITAVENNKHIQVANKMRQVADMLEAKASESN